MCTHDDLYYDWSDWDYFTMLRNAFWRAFDRKVLSHAAYLAACESAYKMIIGAPAVCFSNTTFTKG